MISFFAIEPQESRMNIICHIRDGRVLFDYLAAKTGQKLSVNYLLITDLDIFTDLDEIIFSFAEIKEHINNRIYNPCIELALWVPELQEVIDECGAILVERVEDQ